METVARRNIRSSPERSSLETWGKVTNILCERNSSARAELESINGIASLIITSRVCEESPIIVSCEGPQTRIYCIYDDDAIDGSDAKEDSFNYDPLNGDWSISLPCREEDLEWVKKELEKKCKKISARESSVKSVKIKSEFLNKVSDETNVELNIDRFLNQ